MSKKKLNLKEIRKQYRAEEFSIAQALVSYLEDTDQLVGAVGTIDSVALLAFFRALDIEADPLGFVGPVLNILGYEQAGALDKAWELVEEEISAQEEESEELIEGTLG